MSFAHPLSSDWPLQSCSGGAGTTATEAQSGEARLASEKAHPPYLLESCNVHCHPCAESLKMQCSPKGGLLRKRDHTVRYRRTPLIGTVSGIDPRKTAMLHAPHICLVSFEKDQDLSIACLFFTGSSLKSDRSATQYYIVRAE